MRKEDQSTLTQSLKEMGTEDIYALTQSLTNLLEQTKNSKLEPKQDRDCRTVPAFYGHRSNKINIFDKSNGTTSEIPVEQFEKEQGILWSESPHVHIDRKSRILADETLIVKPLHTVSDLIYFNPPKLAITHINNTVGCGLVAMQDFKQYDIIGIYSGVIDSSLAEPGFNPYAYLCNNENEQSIFSRYYGHSNLDARYVRNYISYLQHAPTQDSLSDLSLPDGIEGLVATSNVIAFKDNHLHWPVILFLASRDIKRGEQLLGDYGTYWAEAKKHGYSDGSYALFDEHYETLGTVKLDGSFQPSSDYKNRTTKKTPVVDYIQIHFELNLHLKEMNVQLQDKKGDYFRENVRQILKTAKEIHGNNYKQLFNRIENCLSERDIINLYNNITTVIKKFNADADKNLSITCHELFLYLHLLRNHFDRKEDDPNKTAPDELKHRKAFADAITSKEWTFSHKQQLFHISDKELTGLESVKDVFARHGINPARFGKAANGDKHFLAYSSKDFCLENFLKVKPDEFKSPDSDLANVGRLRF